MLPRLRIPAVLWSRIGFYADPDPDFYLIADLDPDPGSHTNSDPSDSGSVSDFAVTKLWIFTRKIYILYCTGR
jgi:hypothetical protein